MPEIRWSAAKMEKSSDFDVLLGYSGFSILAVLCHFSGSVLCALTTGLLLQTFARFARMSFN